MKGPESRQSVKISGPMHTVVLPAIAMLACAALVAFGAPAAAQGSSRPIKELISSHFGRDVNKAGGNVCTKAEEGECQGGTEGSGAGEFSYADSVAVGATGDVYVMDGVNQRVQELTPTGEFVSMFGLHVNKKGGDVCTKAEEGECQGGTEGSGAGEFKDAEGIAVDPNAHRIYVEDFGNRRIQEFTETGEFVLTFGEEVNKKSGDICTSAEEDECQAGTRSVAGSTQPYAFNWEQSRGGLLSIGGPEHLLYVGDEHRVQEFDSSGALKGEIRTPLEHISSEPGRRVLAIAADAAGEVFLTYSAGEGEKAFGTTIYKFDVSGKEVTTKCIEGSQACWPRVMSQRTDGSRVFTTISGMATDANGRLAVAEPEQEGGLRYLSFGSLLDGSTGRTITGFAIAPGEASGGVTFGDSDEIYVMGYFAAHEVIAYTPVPVGEPTPTEGECVPASEHDTDVTLECKLTGEINPWEVPDTEAWFEWGRTPALGSVTPKQSICTTPCGATPVPSTFVVENVRPGEGSFYYTLKAEDANVAGEPLVGELASFPTPTVPPKIVVVPTALIVRPSSAVLFGEVNPESASTTYRFQYAVAKECEASELAAGEHLEVGECAGVQETTAAHSVAYGRVGTSAELGGLQPGTLYRSRLVAVNDVGERAEEPTNEKAGEFTTFTTAGVPKVQVVTAQPSAVGVTSAVVTGTVNADGQSATYMFELGLFAGDDTQYGVVSVGSAGAGRSAVVESLQLSGLQSDTTYAYRISARYGDGSTDGSMAIGAPVLFTTGSPPPLAQEPFPLGLLPVPSIPFPVSGASHHQKCKAGYKRNPQGKCVKAKAKPRKKSKKKAPHKAGRRGTRSRVKGSTGR